jgi:hypothetical protein
MNIKEVQSNELPKSERIKYIWGEPELAKKNWFE